MCTLSAFASLCGATEDLAVLLSWTIFCGWLVRVLGRRATAVARCMLRGCHVGAAGGLRLGFPCIIRVHQSSMHKSRTCCCALDAVVAEGCSSAALGIDAVYTTHMTPRALTMGQAATGIRCAECYVFCRASSDAGKGNC